MRVLRGERLITLTLARSSWSRAENTRAVGRRALNWPLRRVGALRRALHRCG
jgi:hypothetical protein